MTPGCPEPDRPRTDEMNARLLPCRKRMIHANRQRRQSVFDRYPQPLPFRGEPARRDRTVSRCPDTTAHTLVHRLPSGVVQRSQDRFECREKRRQAARTGRKSDLDVTYQLSVIACQYSRPSAARPNMAPCLLIDGIDSDCLLCAIAGQVDIPDAERMARVRSETPELRSNDCAPRPRRSPMPAHGPAHTRGAERQGHARWTTRRTSGRHRPIRR